MKKSWVFPWVQGAWCWDTAQYPLATTHPHPYPPSYMGSQLIICFPLALTVCIKRIRLYTVFLFSTIFNILVWILGICCWMGITRSWLRRSTQVCRQQSFKDSVKTTQDMPPQPFPIFLIGCRSSQKLKTRGLGTGDPIISKNWVYRPRYSEIEFFKDVIWFILQYMGYEKGPIRLKKRPDKPKIRHKEAWNKPKTENGLKKWVLRYLCLGKWVDV